MTDDRETVADVELRSSGGDVERPGCFGTGDVYDGQTSVTTGVPWSDAERKRRGVPWSDLATVRPDVLQEEDDDRHEPGDDPVRDAAHNWARHFEPQRCPCCLGARVVDRATAATWAMGVRPEGPGARLDRED